MLSAHALLIAAVFIPYVLLMVGLGTYIYRSGQPRGADRDQDDGEPPGPVTLPAAA